MQLPLEAVNGWYLPFKNIYQKLSGTQFGRPHASIIDATLESRQLVMYEDVEGDGNPFGRSYSAARDKDIRSKRLLDELALRSGLAAVDVAGEVDDAGGRAARDAAPNPGLGRSDGRHQGRERPIMIASDDVFNLGAGHGGCRGGFCGTCEVECCAVGAVEATDNVASNPSAGLDVGVDRSVSILHRQLELQRGFAQQQCGSRFR
uniref:DDE Tnp4 domain-containing protein n=1 Tax=Panagrellus redivivus TaxID=6233 RepID=A0A7E4VVX6_PANRE